MEKLGGSGRTFQRDKGSRKAWEFLPQMVKGSGNPPRKCPKLSGSGIIDQFAQMIGHTNLIG